jgi:hypothetical protein
LRAEVKRRYAGAARSVGEGALGSDLGEPKDAGLVCEGRRGKWSFYSFDCEAAGGLLIETANLLGITTGGSDDG